METNIIKIGNSKGIIIPAEILRKMSLAESCTVSLTIDGDTLIMHGNNMRSNLLKTRFYVCPVCGNIIHCIGDAAITCHGIHLQPLEFIDASKGPEINIEHVEDEWFVSIKHEMTKKKYISFIAAVSPDRVQLVKLYPEGNAEARFKNCGIKYIYYFCNTDGLFRLLTPTPHVGNKSMR